MPLYAELAFVNGPIQTQTDAPAQALAVSQGKIVALGEEAQVRALAGERTRVIDLNGRALLPGFIDAHTHLLRTGMEHTLYLDADAPSLDELLQRVEAEAKAREPGQWVVGRGWDDGRWSGGRYPSRADLDRVAPDHPVALIRVCGHILCVNGRALQEVPVKDDAHTVDRDHGWLREESAWTFLDRIEPDLEVRLAALRAGIAHAHACGITQIHDIADRNEIETYHALQRAGELSLRVRLNVLHPLLDSLIALGIGGEFGDPFLRVGALKLFSDGSLGARNAALGQPYSDDPHTSGQLNFAQDALVGWMRRGREAGFQLMTHAIGDRAIGAVLDAYEAVGVKPQERARIEHLELPSDAHIDRMARLGVVASMQPNFLQWSGPGKLYQARLGAGRDARIDPHRRVLDSGVALAFSSDSMPVDPLYGVRLAVQAPHEGQRLSAAEALAAYTRGGAYAGFGEAAQGALKVGAWADLVVLSGNPLARLDGVRVSETFVAGRSVFCRST